MTVGDDAVDRNLVAGLDAQYVSDLHLIQVHLFFRAVRIDAQRRVGGERQQGFDGGIGAGAGAQFEHLTEEHQGGDGRGRLEVQRRHAIHLEGRGQKLRPEQSNDAEEPRRAGAQTNQAEHVELPAPETMPTRA